MQRKAEANGGVLNLDQATAGEAGQIGLEIQQADNKAIDRMIKKNEDTKQT